MLLIGKVFGGFIVNANNEHTGTLFGMHLIQVMAVPFTVISVTFIYWFIGSTLSNSCVTAHRQLHFTALRYNTECCHGNFGPVKISVRGPKFSGPKFR